MWLQGSSTHHGNDESDQARSANGETTPPLGEHRFRQQTKLLPRSQLLRTPFTDKYFYDAGFLYDERYCVQYVDVTRH